MKTFKKLLACLSLMLSFTFISCSKDDVNKILDGVKDVISDESIRKTWELKTFKTEFYIDGEKALEDDIKEYKTITATKDSEYLRFTNDLYYTQVGYTDGEKMFNVGGYAYVWLTSTLKVTIGTQILSYKVTDISDTKLVTLLEYPYAYVSEETGDTIVYDIKETKTYASGSASVISTVTDLINSFN